jgi:hypothetical protein
VAPVFDTVLNSIGDWVHDLLADMVTANVSTMFLDVNEKTAAVAGEAAATPADWNASIFSLVQGLSDNVILPIAGVVITYVLVAELIGMVIERNNLHEVDTWMFFKYIFKACVAVLLLSNAFTIVMALFDVGQYLETQATGLVSTTAAIDTSTALATIESSLDTMELGELAMLAVETAVVSLAMKIISVLVTVIMYGRMIEIYLSCSVAPIPIATLANREWGMIGQNYLRGIAALALQGFFIVVCVGIYVVLVADLPNSSDLHAAVFSLAAVTVLLAFCLFKTSSLAKSILSAH